MNLLDSNWQQVVDFCANECKRQKSGEQSVARMVRAYNYLLEAVPHPDHDRPSSYLIRELGYMIEPIKNEHGFRVTAVTINSRPVGLPHAHIPRAIDLLCEAWENLHPNVWYHEFEKVHPFRDGNGRVGAILWNWRRNKLDWPEQPPDMFALDRTDDKV